VTTTTIETKKPEWTQAATEVAEINKLLGKPLTDEKALGFIKNLLLHQVHHDLAKSMEQGTATISYSLKNLV